MSLLPQILCVDDEKNVLSSLQRFFLDEKYEVLTAESGPEALAILEKNPSIQVVISDYQMPGMNGVELLRQVSKRWPETVRIIISGKADAVEAVEAISEGQIFKFFPKPWDDDDFRETIADAVKIYTQRIKISEYAKELVESEWGVGDCSKDEGDYLQQVLFELPVAVISLDWEYKVIQSNKCAEKLFALPGVSLRGEFSSVLPHEVDRCLQDRKEGYVETKIEFNETVFLVKVKKIRTSTRSYGWILVLDPIG